MPKMPSEAEVAIQFFLMIAFMAIGWMARGAYVAFRDNLRNGFTLWGDRKK